MNEASAYIPRRQCETLNVTVRGLQYAVHSWGDPQNKPLFLLHGWADTGRSFQFLADALSDNWYLLAPDWRGFGDSDWNTQGYWFPDYLADLDSLLEYFSAEKPVPLMGHSMGGNVACLYAGICPQRVSHLISLDVFGLPESNPADAPGRYQHWLQQLKDKSRFTTYAELAQLVEHISKLAPGIRAERARFIAESWSRPLAEGEGYVIKADPAHKHVNPVLYRREEARSCWRNITAKTLLIFGEDSRFYQSYYKEGGFQQDCQACFSDLREDSIAAAGHMLHLQAPEKLADKLEKFLS